MRLTAVMIGILFVGLVGQTALADEGGIHMLPPQDFNGNPCSAATGGLLYWDGATSIKCIPGIVGDQNGSLGIGTSSPEPGMLLEVDSNVQQVTNINLMQTNASSGNYFANILFQNTNGIIGNISATGAGYTTPASLFLPNNFNILGGQGDSSANIVIATNTSGAIQFATGGYEASNERMRITPSGNVGIGTSTPLAALHVLAPTIDNNMTGILIEEQSSAQSSPRIGFVDTALGPNNMAPAWYVDNLQDNFRIFRQPNIFIPGFEVLRIDNGGHVGIGTTVPQTILDAHGIVTTAESLPVIRCDVNGYNVTPGYGQGGYTFENDGCWDTGMYSPADGDLRFYSSSLLAMTVWGNTVGINTTGGGNGYALYVNGTVYATGGAGALSDIRHKDNVQTLALGGIATIEKLRPVTFRWKDPKDDGMKGEQLGFIAQEVEKVLPQLVLTSNDSDKTKSLKYDQLIPVLAKAIQEEQAEIEELNSEIKTARK